MRKNLLSLFLLSTGICLAQSVATLPAYESFDYTIDSQIIEDDASVGQGSWSTTAPHSNSDVIVVASPSWSTISGIDAPTGNAIQFQGSGVNPEYLFTPQTGDFGTIYMSALIKVTSIESLNTTAQRVFGFGKQNSGGSISGATHLLVRLDAGEAGYNIGVNNTNSASNVTWDSTVYSIDTELMIVLYFDDSNTGTTAKMWINPTVGGSEPTPTLTDPDSRDLDVDRIQIYQHNSANTPEMIFDELRIGKSWTAVTKPSTLSVKSNKLESLSVYPNPINKSEELFINTTSQDVKQVTIYNVLGKKMLQKNEIKNSIDISSLKSGFYFVEVNQDGKTAVRKLLVK